jgi:hypothetical protein
MTQRAQHTFFTSPWRGEVGSPTGPRDARPDDRLREPGGGELSLHPVSLRSATLPLKGRVGARHGGIA